MLQQLTITESMQVFMKTWNKDAVSVHRPSTNFIKGTKKLHFYSTKTRKARNILFLYCFPSLFFLPHDVRSYNSALHHKRWQALTS